MMTFTDNRTSRFASLLIMLLGFACVQTLSAGSVSRWSPSIEDPNRTLELIEGTITDWSWKNGVSITDWKNKKHTVKRKNIFEVYRNNERDAETDKAIKAGDFDALVTASKNAKDEMDRDEAHYEATRISLATRNATSTIAIYQSYISSFPDGNFLGLVHRRLADLQMRGGQNNQALNTFEAMTRLGDAQRAFALVQSGDIHIAAKANEKALESFEAAIEPARNVADPSLQVRALGWGGEAARLLGNEDKAKQMFDALFEVPTKRGLNGDARQTRGIAYKGLGIIAGMTKEAYRNLQLASFWLAGSIHEGSCVHRMWKVADSLSGTNSDEPRWGEDANKLRTLIQARWPSLLDDNDE